MNFQEETMKKYRSKYLKRFAAIFFGGIGICILSVLIVINIDNTPFFIGLIGPVIFIISLIYFGITSIKERMKIELEVRQHYQQKLKAEDTNPIITCPVCQKQISRNATSCPSCGEPMAKRCPKCKSTDVERITGAEKGVSAVMLGAFAANTVLSDYYCKACGEKFK